MKAATVREEYPSSQPGKAWGVPVGSQGNYTKFTFPKDEALPSVVDTWPLPLYLLTVTSGHGKNWI